MYTPVIVAAFAALTHAKPLSSRVPQCGTPAPGPNDNAAYYQSDPTFSEVASNAQTPAGYIQTVSNYNAIFNAPGYLTMEHPGQLGQVASDSDYNAAIAHCANACSEMLGCTSFSIYYERYPAEDPSDACPQPSSFPYLTCAYYSSFLDASTATNSGQYRGDFQVVERAVNAYVVDVPGYTGEYYDNVSLNSPCGYTGQTSYKDGKFDVTRCADDCNTNNAYWNAHGGTAQNQCVYYNTYVQMRNGQYDQQTCAFYNTVFDDSYYTNVGQYQGSDQITISYSVSETLDSAIGSTTCPTS